MPERILIVGDDPNVSGYLSQALAGNGFLVSTMPASRCSQFPASRPQSDLIIFEDVSPGTEGWDAVPRIRQVSSVPIIALTTRGRQESAIASLDRGADYCLVWPSDIREFQARVRALLRRARFMCP